MVRRSGRLSHVLYSLAVAFPVGLAASAADFTINGLVFHQAYTPVETFFIAVVICFPVAYLLINQQMQMRRARDGLMRAQEEKAVAFARLEVALEDAEAANRAKSTFLATMSHEIRTPLNGVLGMAQAMESDELTDRQRERVEIIRESGQALLAVLNDILDISKIEAGRLEIEEIDFDLATLVGGVSAAFTQLANKKGVSFALDIEAAQGVYRGDPTRVRQILYNLVSNALKFTEAGEIRVRAERIEDELRILVKDTGIGMSEAVQGALFAKFKQADASTTRRFGGTGLGLAICRELAELMGGRISVASELGRGSIFTVTLRLPFVGEAREIGAPTPASVGAEAPMALRVLAAEDNTTNQLVLRTLLLQFEIDPIIVGDGQEAVERWVAEPFDLILMDVQMPKVDGLDATRQIRRLELSLSRPRIPIIALTANAMSHQVREYAEAGMDGFIAKPIEAAKLYEALVTAMAGGDERGAASAA